MEIQQINFQFFCSDYKEYHTDTTVRFVVSMTEEKFHKAMGDGVHKTFKLQSSISTSCMVIIPFVHCLH